MRSVPYQGMGWVDMLTMCVASCYLLDYTHERHTVHLIVYHIIWCPKRRRKVLTGKVAERLEQLIHEEFSHLMRMSSLWTRSTFYSTAGSVSAETIQQYNERQSKV
jgi:REP element-mobilizing transposase RayT